MLKLKDSYFLQVLMYTCLLPMCGFLLQNDDLPVPLECAREQGEQLSFCLQSVGKYAIQAYDHYQEVRLGCNWSDISPSWLYYRHYQSEAHYTARNFSQGSAELQSKLHLRACDLDDFERDSSWRFQQVGPMHGVGGRDFHDFLAPVAAWKQKPIYLLAMGAMPVDAVGSPLGFPPIHLHHTHIGSMRAYYELNRLASLNFDDSSLPFEAMESPESWLTSGSILDVHGDRQCHIALGGIKCLLFSMPSGFGIRIDTDWFVWGMLNDIRPKPSTSLSFSMEYIVEYQHEEIGSLFNPASVAFFWVCRVHGIPGHTEDFDIPADAPSVMWRQFVFLRTGHFLRNYFHGHHKYVDALWIASATPHELGFFDENKSFAWQAPRQDKYHTHSVLRLRLQALQDRCKEKRCHVPKGMMCMTQDKRVENGFDRFMPAHCPMTEFLEGQHITMVAFFNLPRDTTSTGVGRRFQRQHVVFYFWYQLLPASNSTTYPLAALEAPAENPNCMGSTS